MDHPLDEYYPLLSGQRVNSNASGESIKDYYLSNCANCVALGVAIQV